MNDAREGNELSRDAGDRRRVFVVGARTLYLQPLCELLNSTGEHSAELAAPAGAASSSDGQQPDVVVIDCEDATEEAVELGGTLFELNADSSFVFLGSGQALEGVESAGCLERARWASTDASLGEIVQVIAGRGRPPVRESRRPRTGPGVPAGDSPLAALTGRERAVLQLIVDGRSGKEIAARLGISPHTVRTHLQNTMAKLLVGSRTELVSLAHGLGMRAARAEQEG